MAQEIQVITWCDVCADDSPDARQPADPYRVRIDDGPDMTVDLCVRHDETLLAPLRKLLAVHGHRPDAPAPARRGRPRTASTPEERAKFSRPTTCLWCGEAFAMSNQFSRHLVRAHGFPDTNATGADVAGIFGGRCPYCGHGTPTPAAFGVHIAAHHPGRPAAMSSAFIAARDDGDPAGVVAPVLALAPGGKYRAPRGRRRS